MTFKITENYKKMTNNDMLTKLQWYSELITSSLTFDIQNRFQYQYNWVSLIYILSSISRAEITIYQIRVGPWG